MRIGSNICAFVGVRQSAMDNKFDVVGRLEFGQAELWMVMAARSMRRRRIRQAEWLTGPRHARVLFHGL